MKNQVKGDPRKSTARDRKIRALASRIPDADVLATVLSAVPAKDRDAFARALRPLLKFKTA